MVVIDATALLLMLRPGTPVPPGPNGIPVDRPKERIDYLIAQLDKTDTKIIIPTPALSEALVRAGAAASQQIVEHLQKWSAFQIQPFDTRAAIEVAAMTRSASGKGNKRGTSTAIWAKVKFDRQIVAIAKVAGATAIYSDDGDIKTLGKESKIDVIAIADLPLPPQDAQIDLFKNEVQPGNNLGDRIDNGEG
jgi:predicted nucleic acid-binding protein